MEDAVVTSSRPLACDFLRLRFARNACFNRSWRGSFAGCPDCPSLFSFSFFIVRLSVVCFPRRSAIADFRADRTLPVLTTVTQIYKMAARGRRNDQIRGHDTPDRGAGGMSRGNGEPDRPATAPVEGGRGHPAPILAFWKALWTGPRACAPPDLVARISPPCRGLFGRFS